MSKGMLFAPQEIQEAKAKKQKDLADYKDKLHANAMAEGDLLQKDKELDLLIFEGIVRGFVDGDNPNTLKIVERVHSRIEKLEERASRSKES